MDREQSVRDHAKTQRTIITAARARVTLTRDGSAREIVLDGDTIPRAVHWHLSPVPALRPGDAVLAYPVDDCWIVLMKLSSKAETPRYTVRRQGNVLVYETKDVLMHLNYSDAGGSTTEIHVLSKEQLALLSPRALSGNYSAQKEL